MPEDLDERGASALGAAHALDHGRASITFSRAVNSGRRWWNWKTKPIVLLRNAAIAADGRLQKDVLAARTSDQCRRSVTSSVPRTCRNVDFPEPEGPMMEMRSPSLDVEVDTFEDLDPRASSSQ